MGEIKDIKDSEESGKTGDIDAAKVVKEKKDKPNKEKKVEKKFEVDESKSKLAVSCRKDEDFALWYSDTISKSEMIEYYDISGCYILRPWSFSIWENIQKFLDAKIKSVDVENTCFPLFVSEKALNKEKDHIEGFSPEVAWITKAGKNNLENP